MIHSHQKLINESYTKSEHNPNSWPVLYIWPEGQLCLNTQSSTVFFFGPHPLFTDVEDIWVEKSYAALQDARNAGSWTTKEGSEVWIYLAARFGPKNVECVHEYVTRSGGLDGVECIKCLDVIPF